MNQRIIAYVFIVFSSLFLALEIFGMPFTGDSFSEPQEVRTLVARLDKIEHENQQLQAEVRRLREDRLSEASDSPLLVDTIREAQPSVVSIVATRDLVLYKRGSSGSVFDPFRQPTPRVLQRQIQTGGGSGFIYSEDGYIITNKHVVSDSDARYTVVLFDGTELEAAVVARDRYMDVAVLRVDPQNSSTALTPISLGRSEDLEVGERVIAIGNALAEFQNTVTTGIISAVNRNISTLSPQSRAEHFTNLIQTDAAINPGNSGGPLINMKGEVIGINTAVAREAEGIGFAIPVDDIRVIAESVKQYGRIVRPYLGIRYIPLSPQSAQALGTDVMAGAYIRGSDSRGAPGIIPHSPAANAGLLEQDIIVSIDSLRITTDRDLRTILQQYSVGDSVSLEILRDGVLQTVPIRLQEMP
jgi:serine protease Do